METVEYPLEYPLIPMETVEKNYLLPTSALPLPIIVELVRFPIIGAAINEIASAE